jgi:BirA family biotin operon repressor/biotin-[acetyl-CoA-carboxylase] ligase
MSGAAGPRGLRLGPELRTEHLGRIVELHRTLPSTSDRAIALARGGAAAGLCVVADTQSAGRGQRGRAWHSPPGAGLYASTLLRPDVPVRVAPSLTLVIGVAVAEALAPFSRYALGLKWPNDVLVASGPLFGRKLAGILVEASASPRRVEHAVVGIGVNLARTALPPALLESATSLEHLGGAPPAREVVLAAILARVEDWMTEAEDRGLERVTATFERLALGVGQPVELLVDGELRRGVLAGLAPDGALRLDEAGGEVRHHRGELRLPGVPRALDRT